MQTTIQGSSLLKDTLLLGADSSSGFIFTKRYIIFGLEDNIWFDNQRTKLATNKSLLERIASMIKLMDKEIMPASELRPLLKLALP